jgi:amino-acid N-acetyltransferase
MIEQKINDTQQLDAFKGLLREARLPIDDLDNQKQLLVGFYQAGELIGTGGLEIFDSCALLRSIAVRSDFRGKSIGSSITKKMLQEAGSKGVKDIYLLTETAHDFFQQKGFEDIDRHALPATIRGSFQFQSACPASAKAMHLKI